MYRRLLGQRFARSRTTSTIASRSELAQAIGLPLPWRYRDRRSAVRKQSQRRTLEDLPPLNLVVGCPPPIAGAVPNACFRSDRCSSRRVAAASGTHHALPDSQSKLLKRRTGCGTLSRSMERQISRINLVNGLAQSARIHPGMNLSHGVGAGHRMAQPTLPEPGCARQLRRVAASHPRPNQDHGGFGYRGRKDAWIRSVMELTGRTERWNTLSAAGTEPALRTAASTNVSTLQGAALWFIGVSRQGHINPPMRAWASRTPERTQLRMRSKLNFAASVVSWSRARNNPAQTRAFDLPVRRYGVQKPA